MRARDSEGIVWIFQKYFKAKYLEISTIVPADGIFMWKLIWGSLWIINSWLDFKFNSQHSNGNVSRIICDAFLEILFWRKLVFIGKSWLLLESVYFYWKKFIFTEKKFFYWKKLSFIVESYFLLQKVNFYWNKLISCRK